MGKWSFIELFEPQEGQADFEEIYLSPYEVEPSENNFYSQENIEELADSILTVGQQQPIVLGRVNGVYKIISGHRRNLANIHNIECGAVPRDYKARYLYKDMSAAMMELSLLVGNAFNRKLSPYEETEQAARLKAALIRARDEDNLVIQGRMRDLIAEILQTSPSEVARMNKINSSLVPEAKEQFREGNLSKSAAYETSKLLVRQRVKRLSIRILQSVCGRRTSRRQRKQQNGPREPRKGQRQPRQQRPRRDFKRSERLKAQI